MSLYCLFRDANKSGVTKCSLGADPPIANQDGQICKTIEKYKKCPFYLKKLEEWATENIYWGYGTDTSHKFAGLDKDGKLLYSTTYTTAPYDGNYCSECNTEIFRDKDIDSYNIILKHARSHLEGILKEEEKENE